jgi:hypothetical protein
LSWEPEALGTMGVYMVFTARRLTKGLWQENGDNLNQVLEIQEKTTFSIFLNNFLHITFILSTLEL